MNPQVQQYRQYPQAQTRTPASRRPGECAPSTNTSLHTHPGSYAQGQLQNTAQAQLLYQMSSQAFGQMASMPTPGYLAGWQLPTPGTSPNMTQNMQMLTYVNGQISYRPHDQHMSSYSAAAYPVPHPQLVAHPLYSYNYLPYGPGQIPQTAQQFAAQQAQLQHQRQQQQNAVLEHQQAQRRARRPTDKNMPDGIEDMIIGNGVDEYKALREQERRLDYAMMRKRLDLHDTANRNTKRQRTLRIWVSNTASKQPWQQGALEENAFDFQTAGEGTVRVKVEGRLLDDPDDDIMSSDDEEDDEPKPAAKKTPLPKMSKFFKHMTIDYDRNRNNVPDPGWQVEWKKQANANEVDVIECQRKCDENINVTISLTRDEQPERYRLSHVLASTLDMDEGDRAEVVMALWEYIRCSNLQEDEDKRSIRCDDQLRQIFSREQIYFPQIPDLIMQHLHPLPPVKLQYTVRVDQEYISNPQPTVYDIRVHIEDPLRAKLYAMSLDPELAAGMRQIAQLDEQLAVVVQALQHSKARHTFYKAMSKDPAGFIDKWMKSQRRDLEVILGEAGRGGGEDGSGPEFARGGKDGVWGSQSVEEAVRYMLAKPQAPKASS